LFTLTSMAYSKKVIERFEAVTNNPAAHGVGRFDPNDPNVAIGLTGAPACGDVMKLDLKIDPGNDRIASNQLQTETGGKEKEEAEGRKRY
jgi:NifU-like protein involved in Fe-S cluster formation